MNLMYVQRKIRVLKKRIAALCEMQDNPTCTLSPQRVEEMLLTAEADLLRFQQEEKKCLEELPPKIPTRLCIYCNRTALKGDPRCARCKKQGRKRIKGHKIKVPYDAEYMRIANKRSRMKKLAEKLRAQGREVDAVMVEVEREKLLDGWKLKQSYTTARLPVPIEMPTTVAGKRKMAQLKRRLEEEIEVWRELGEYTRARELEIQLQQLPPRAAAAQSDGEG